MAITHSSLVVVRRTNEFKMAELKVGKRWSAHLYALKESKIYTIVLFNSLKYLSGFGNEFASEALPDALPKRQVSRLNIVDVNTKGLEVTVRTRG